MGRQRRLLPPRASTLAHNPNIYNPVSVSVSVEYIYGPDTSLASRNLGATTMLECAAVVMVYRRMAEGRTDLKHSVLSEGIPGTT